MDSMNADKHRTKTQTTKDSFEKLDSNKVVIKALVIGTDETVSGSSGRDNHQLGASKVQAQEEYWNKYDGLYIEAPLNMEWLSSVEEYSTILRQCIEAMEINIEGFGHRLKPILQRDQIEENDPEIKAIDEERRQISNFLANANGEDSLVALRRKLRHDLEATGNAFLEVVRHPHSNLPNRLIHVPSYQIRLGKTDNEYTKYTQKRQIEVGPNVYKTEEVTDLKRFRKYLQLQYGLASGPGVVWFKEYGDPRVIDCESGEVVADEKLKSFPDDRRANEMIHLKIYSARTPYGLPRFVGCLITLLGDREAEQVNFYTLKNNNIPSMIVMLSNGMITQESVTRMEDFVKQRIQGNNNYSTFLVLEAENIFDAQGTDAGQMRMDIKPLTPYQNKDQLFQEYGASNRSKIRESFRLPPIFLGLSEDYTKSIAETSRRLADEQIFAPERDEMDHLFNRILAEFDMKYHTFKSNSPNITDDEDLLKLLIAAEKTGGMIPRIAMDIVSDILGRPAVEKWPEGVDPDVPFSLQMAEAVKNKALPYEVGQQVTALKSQSVDTVAAIMEIRSKMLDELYKR